MDGYQIEPVLFLCTWLEELDLSGLKGLIKSFISHVAKTIESKLCISFL